MDNEDSLRLVPEIDGAPKIQVLLKMAEEVHCFLFGLREIKISFMLLL